MSLILTQNKTNKKIQIFQSLQNNTTNETTHTHSDRRSKYKHTWKSTKYVFDINIQHQELDKGMLIENNLKCKPSSKQPTDASWLVTMIKAILKTPIQKSEKPILLFRRTHTIAFNNRKYSRHSKLT